MGYARGPSYVYNTVRDLGNVNGIRDLTQLRDSPKFEHGCGTRKKTIFGIAMTEFRDAGFS